MKRRTLLRHTAAGGTVAAAAGAGLLAPRTLLAAWPQPAFEARSYSAAMRGLHGAEAAVESDAIAIKAPEIAENGAVVPVSVTTTLDDVESIAIVAVNNPTPLNSKWSFTAAIDPFVSTRIKLAQTSDVVAVVKAGGRLYRTSREVKVTIGGCGG